MRATLELRRRSAHVAEVWLDRPDVRNAFNDGVIAELTEAFRVLAADGEISATLRDETARRIADIRASAEGREGVQVFLNKRDPAWK